MKRWRRDEEFTTAHVVRNHHWWTGPVAWFLSHVYWNVQVHGREHFPMEGPVIVASNHIGVADGPVLYMAVPRPPHIMVKLGMMRARFGFFLRWSGEFPVDRKNGRAGLQIALDLLREGRVVVIYPEGTRGSGTAGDIKAGVGWLAQHSGAPVVPAACLNTRPTGATVGYMPPFRATPVVVFGEPIVLPADLPKGRAGTAAALELIQHRLAAHVEHAVELTGIALPADAGVRDERDFGRTED